MTPVFNDLPIPSTAYRGAVLHSLAEDSVRFLPDGGLLVDSQGRIVACDHWEAVQASLTEATFEVVQLQSGRVLTPGFVDTHVHLPQMAVAGCQEKDLLSWLESHIFAEESRFADDAYAQRISEWFFNELLANGTTLANVFLTSHQSAARIAFETAERVGNRVVMGQNLMDRNGPESLLRPATQLLTETEQLCQEWHGRDQGRIQYAWVPRFAITSTEALLKGVGALRQRYPDVYLHTHLSEQLPEIEAVKLLFPTASDYTNVYEGYGLLGARTVLAHGVHLTDSELDRLKQQDCSLAHCPSSNFFLKSGRFPLQAVLGRQIRLGLGSDVGAGPDLSLLQVMKAAQFMQAEHLASLKTLFYLATLGGAKALDADHRVGNFLPGKEADFVILNLNARSALKHHSMWTKLEQGDVDALLSALVYLGDDRLVDATFVRGRQVFQRN